MTTAPTAATLSGAVDYWCNAFTPDRRAVWDAAIAGQGLTLAVRRETDEFCSPDAMATRMDDVGFSTLMLVACDEHQTGGDDTFAEVAARPSEMDELHASDPARFVATWSIDPSSGMAGVRRAAEMLAQPWCVGLHTHTHSWDRRFDHADYYPYYALAADEEVPFVMQAGTSGGRFPSECGQPIGIDRPAIYFPTVRFVLSHTGWPWTSETIAMALKFSNVYLGTATWPPKRWSEELIRFIGGSGRNKCLFGTGFPTSGHHNSAAQLVDLGLTPEVLENLTSTTARTVFSRLNLIE